jgi:hypothetical protein
MSFAASVDNSNGSASGRSRRMWSAYTTDRSCSTCKAVIGLLTSSMGLRLSAATAAPSVDRVDRNELGWGVP